MVQSYDGQKTMFDVTIPADNYKSAHALMDVLSTVFKKFCFQKEQGDTTDYVHWQVRGSLHKPITCAGLLRKIVPVVTGHWSLTSSTVHGGPREFNYVMKVDSRLEGPWTDKDVIPEPPPLTTQLKEFLTYEFYPWQRDMLRMIQSANFRHLHYICDPHYNSGKSIFSEYLMYKGLALECPPIMSMEDLLQFLFSQPDASTYVLDLPAALRKEKVHSLYAGLEALKNGYLYDKRYSGKMRRINRPNIFVFANNYPQTHLMAPDRWQVYQITPDKKIVQMCPQPDGNWITMHGII